VADDVRPRDPKIVHQRTTVRSLLRNTERTRHTATARIASAMVMHHTISVGEGRILQEGFEKVGADAGMHQHDRLAGSLDFVLKFNALESCPIHVFHTVPP
jgi:hypothetical protein